jgi:RNA polymerase sigma-70 factor (sigma-E family)
VETPVGFEEFVREQSRALLRTAWLLTGNWAEAEDLVQSALAATWTHWPSITRYDAPQVYTRRVIVTTFLRWRRRRWVDELATLDLPERPSADDAFARSDKRESLLDALRILPPRQRAAITLRYFADLSERDTARTLGCSAGAVKSHCSKAIARLRDTPLLAGLLDEEVRNDDRG